MSGGTGTPEDGAGWRGFPAVAGRCPGCGGRGSLFVASGGWVTCSNIPCSNPTAWANAMDPDAADPNGAVEALRAAAGERRADTEAADADAEGWPWGPPSSDQVRIIAKGLRSRPGIFAHDQANALDALAAALAARPKPQGEPS